MSALVLFALLSIAGEPDAGTVASAKSYFEAGKQAYAAGRYSTAITAFEESYRLVPKPAILFSTAQSYRQQALQDQDPEKTKRAIELFRQYLEQVPKGGRADHAAYHLAELEPMLRRLEVDPRRSVAGAPKSVEGANTQVMITSITPGALAGLDDDDELIDVPVIRDVKPGPHRVRVEAPGHLGQSLDLVAVEGRLVLREVTLEAKPAAVSIRAPEGAEVTVDGQQIGEAPLTGPLAVPAGSHLFVVSDRGRYPFARALNLERGQEIIVDADLEVTTQRVVSYWVLGASAAALILGGVSGAIALAAEGTARSIDETRLEREGLSEDDIDEYQRALDRRDVLAPISITALVGGAVLGVGGALLFVLDLPRPESTALSSGALRIAPTPGGAGASWSAAF